MTPHELIVADWQARPRDRSLRWYEEIHLDCGFVFSTPDFFVMGRPVRKYAPLEQILDVTHHFDPATCDTWYVFQMAGDIRKVWSILPQELPWVCWHREGDLEPDGTERLRFYETRRVMRLSGVLT